MAAVSIAINVIGTATTPFVDEYLPDPIVSVYPRLAAHGAMSINPNRFLTPADQVDERWVRLEDYPTASYNLGELLGLHGWLSLGPLAGAWALGIGWRRRQRGAV